MHCSTRHSCGFFTWRRRLRRNIISGFGSIFHCLLGPFKYGICSIFASLSTAISKSCIKCFLCFCFICFFKLLIIISIGIIFVPRIFTFSKSSLRIPDFQLFLCFFRVLFILSARIFTISFCILLNKSKHLVRSPFIHHLIDFFPKQAIFFLIL